MSNQIQYLKSCAINEQVYISCLLNNEHLLDHEEKCYCLNQLSIDIFNSIKKLHDDNVSLTIQTVAAEVLKINSDVNVDIIAALKDKIEHNEEDFHHYKKNIVEAYVKNQVQSNILKRLSSNLLSKGQLDLDALDNTITDIQWAIDTVKQKNGKLKDFQVVLHEYEEDFNNRGNNSSFSSSGDSYLDSHLAGGGIPHGQFITLFSSPGMGKSSYVRRLVNGNINKRTPLLYLPLEMGQILSIDGLLSARMEIPLNDLYNVDQGSGTLPDYILEAFYLEKQKLLKNNYFRLVDSASVSLQDVHNFIKDMKKDLRLKSLTVAIDLFTMLVEGRGDNKASSYQDLCDNFFEILKEENASGITVVQSRRKTDVHVTTYEDCRRYLPKIEEIKGSQAFEERSRAIISIFRQKHVGIRMLGKDDPEVMVSDDILEATILKQNLGSLAELKYLYQGDIGKLWRYEEPND